MKEFIAGMIVTMVVGAASFMMKLRVNNTNMINVKAEKKEVEYNER